MSDDGKPLVATLGRSGGTGDLMANAKVTAKAQEGGVRYDLRVPLKELGLDEKALQNGFRFNLIVNDSDGQGRNGMIQIAPGIGQYKDASRFPTVRFHD